LTIEFCAVYSNSSGDMGVDQYYSNTSHPPGGICSPAPPAPSLLLQQAVAKNGLRYA